MRDLLKGVHQFQANYFSKPWELFEKLSLSQHPRILFITCCDTRIDPNQITQTQPGGMLIIRNIGNIIPPYGATNGAEGAAIEYAIQTLGIIGGVKFGALSFPGCKCSQRKAEGRGVTKKLSIVVQPSNRSLIVSHDYFTHGAGLQWIVFRSG